MSSFTDTWPSGAAPSLATLPTVTYRYSTGAPMTTALLPTGSSELTVTTVVKCPVNASVITAMMASVTRTSSRPRRLRASFDSSRDSRLQRLRWTTGPRMARSPDTATPHAVILIPLDVPQNRTVISMSEKAMATTLARIARPAALPTPSGPPPAL